MDLTWDELRKEVTLAVENEVRWIFLPGYFVVCGTLIF